MSVLALAPAGYIVCSDFLTEAGRTVRAHKRTRLLPRWPECAPPAGVCVVVSAIATRQAGWGGAGSVKLGYNAPGSELDIQYFDTLIPLLIPPLGYFLIAPKARV